jgi:hypothetical protein
MVIFTIKTETLKAGLIVMDVGAINTEIPSGAWMEAAGNMINTGTPEVV